MTQLREGRRCGKEGFGMGTRLYTSFSNGGGASYGVRCGDELSDQEWNRMLAERDNVVVDENGKVWRDPGVGNTKPGDNSPFRATEFDAYLAEIEAEKEAKKKARKEAKRAAKAAASSCEAEAVDGSEV